MILEYLLIPLESNDTVRNFMKINLEDFLNEIALRSSRNVVLEGITLVHQLQSP